MSIKIGFVSATPNLWEGVRAFTYFIIYDIINQAIFPEKYGVSPVS